MLEYREKCFSLVFYCSLSVDLIIKKIIYFLIRLVIKMINMLQKFREFVYELMGKKDVFILLGIGRIFVKVFRENGYIMVVFIFNLKVKLGESNRLENNFIYVFII